MFGNVGAGFGSMVGIVQADAHELADPADTGADPHIRHHRRQAAGSMPRSGPAAVVEGRAGDIGHMGGQVADGAVGIENAGLFPAGVAKSNEVSFEISEVCDLDD